MEITGDAGARVIFDPIAGPLLTTLCGACAPYGTIYEYGALYPGETVYPLMPMLAKSLTITGYQVLDFVRDEARFAAGRDYLFAGLESGALTPVIDREFPLEQIVAAHATWNPIPNAARSSSRCDCHCRSPGYGVEPMTKVAELHEKWMREPEYREAYDRLGPAFEFSRCLIEARTRPSSLRLSLTISLEASRVDRASVAVRDCARLGAARSPRGG